MKLGKAELTLMVQFTQSCEGLYHETSTAKALLEGLDTLDVFNIMTLPKEVSQMLGMTSDYFRVLGRHVYPAYFLEEKWAENVKGIKHIELADELVKSYVAEKTPKSALDIITSDDNIIMGIDDATASTLFAFERALKRIFKPVKGVKI